MYNYLLIVLLLSVSLPANAQMLYRVPKAPAVPATQADIQQPQPAAVPSATQNISAEEVWEMVDEADAVYASTVKTARVKAEAEREYDKNLEDSAARSDISDRNETVRNLKALESRHPGFAQGEESVDVNDLKAYKDFIKTKMTPPQD